jgi:pseudaminic acid synthase
MAKSQVNINARNIGLGNPVYFVAEDFDQAVRIIQAAKEAGADAVKFQTLTADTVTTKSDTE